MVEESKKMDFEVESRAFESGAYSTGRLGSVVIRTVYLHEQSAWAQGSTRETR